jgi:hypothetical protein
MALDGAEASRRNDDHRRRTAQAHEDPEQLTVDGQGGVAEHPATLSTR